MGPEYVWRGGVATPYTYARAPHWNYVAHGDVFAANIGTRVLTGSAAAGISGRVHATVGVGAHGGPPPEKLGFKAGDVPHASGGGIAKAKQFGAPSTAAQLGGHAPSAHVAAGAAAGTSGHLSTSTGLQATGGVHGAPSSTTTVSTTGARDGRDDGRHPWREPPTSPR